MLAIQLAVITSLLTAALLAAYSHTAESAVETKIALLNAMDKKFNERSFALLLSQTLETSGETCIEKKHLAGNTLKTLSNLLANRGKQLKLGFARNPNECNCNAPSGLIPLNGIETEVTEAILSCVGEKLQIAKASHEGFAVAQLEVQNTGQIITLNFGELNAG